MASTERTIARNKATRTKNPTRAKESTVDPRRTIHPITGEKICGSFRAHKKEKFDLLGIKLEDCLNDIVLFKEYFCTNHPEYENGWGNGRCKKHGNRGGRPKESGKYATYLPTKVSDEIKAYTNTHQNLEEELNIISALLSRKLGVAFSFGSDSGEVETKPTSFTGLTKGQVAIAFDSIKNGKVSLEEFEEFLSHYNGEAFTPTFTNRSIVSNLLKLQQWVELSIERLLPLAKTPEGLKAIESCHFKEQLTLIDEINGELQSEKLQKEAQAEVERLIDLYTRTVKEEYKRRALDGTYIQKIVFVEHVKELLTIVNSFVTEKDTKIAIHKAFIRTVSGIERGSSSGLEETGNSTLQPVRFTYQDKEE